MAREDGEMAKRVADGIRRMHGSVIEQLYEAMEARGVTKSELAAMVGDSSTMSARTFTPSENITLRTIVRNAEALDCDVTVRLTPRR